nr:DUF1735 domain-containing protein [uncultured Capnocytophaga sp.]
MRKIFLILGLLSLMACQEEWKDDSIQPPLGGEQRAYLDVNRALTLEVKATEENVINNLKVKLLYPSKKIIALPLISGNEELLTAYNTQFGTNYQLLPPAKYNIYENVIFDEGERESRVALVLKDINFSNNEVYALPVQLLGIKNTPVLIGQNECLLIIKKKE